MAEKGSKEIRFDINGVVSDSFKKSISELDSGIRGIKSSIDSIQKAAKNGIYVGLHGNSLKNINQMSSALKEARSALEAFNNKSVSFNLGEQAGKQYKKLVEEDRLSVENVIKGQEEYKKVISQQATLAKQEMDKANKAAKADAEQDYYSLLNYIAAGNDFNDNKPLIKSTDIIDVDGVHKTLDDIENDIYNFSKKSKLTGLDFYSDDSNEYIEQIEDSYDKLIELQELRLDANSRIKEFEKLNKIDTPVLIDEANSVIDVSLNVINWDSIQSKIKDKVESVKYKIKAENININGVADKVRKSLVDAGLFVDHSKQNKEENITKEKVKHNEKQETKQNKDESAIKKQQSTKNDNAIERKKIVEKNVKETKEELKNKTPEVIPVKIELKPTVSELIEEITKIGESPIPIEIKLNSDKIKEQVENVFSNDDIQSLVSKSVEENMKNAAKIQVEADNQKKQITGELNDILQYHTNEVDSLIKKKELLEEQTDSLEESHRKILKETEEAESNLKNIVGKAKEEQVKLKQQAEKQAKDIESTSKQKKEKDIPKMTDINKQFSSEYNKFKKSIEGTKFNILENSFKQNTNGLFEFKEMITGVDGELKVLSHTFKSVDDIVKNGKLNKKELEKQKSKFGNIKIEKPNSSDYNTAIRQTVKKLSSNTKGFTLDEESIKVSKSGITSFSGEIVDADGKLKKLHISVNDFFNEFRGKRNKIGGGFSNKFMNEFGSIIPLDKELNQKKESILELIKNKKILESHLPKDGTKNELLENEINLYNEQIKSQEIEFAKQLKEENIAVEIQTKLLNDLKSAREEVLKNSVKEKDKNINDRQKRLDEATGIYNNIDKYYDKNIMDDSGRIVNPKNEIKQSYEELIALNKKYQSGLYTTKGELDNLNAAQLKAFNNIKKYSSDNYLINNKDGEFSWSDSLFKLPGDIDESSLEDKIKLVQKYEESINKVEVSAKNIKKIKGQDAFKVSYKQDGYLKSEIISMEQLVNESGEASIAFRKQVLDVQKAATTGQKWINGFKNKLKSLSQYFTSSELLQKAFSEIREGFSFVSNLDSLMTTIYQTSDITKIGLDNLSQGAIDQAKALGVTSEQVTGAIEVYTAYGETVDSLLNKSAPTSMLAKATGVDVKVASDQIQGVLQQYKELDGHETKIVNTYEKIGANIKQDFNVAVQNIAEGVQSAGSVAKQAGMDFELFSASVAKTAETTRLSGSQIGNAYKTILSRVSRSKKADPETTLEDRSAAAKSLGDIGIKVYDQNGEYQDFSKTMDELVEKYNELTDAQKSNIAESMAGVRNINIMQSIIETWKEARDLSADVQSDPNFYLDVHEKGLDSLKSKTDTFRASIQDIWLNLLDTNYIRTGISLLTELSNVLSMIIKMFKKLPNLGSVASILTLSGTTFGGIELIDNIKKEREKLKNEKIEVGLFGGVGTGIKNTFSELNTLGLKKGAVLKDNQTAATITSLFAEGKQASGLASGIKNVWTNMTGLSKAVVGTVGAFAAFEAASKIFDEFTNTSKELKESVNSANAQFESQRKRITDNKNSLDSIKSEWSKLSEGVDLKTNENISLTSDEYERFIELNSEIASILPQTVAGMDNQGNAILNLSGSVSQLNNEYEKLLHQESEKRFLDNVKTYADEAKRLSGEAGFWDKSATILDGGDVSDIDGYEKTIDLLDKVSKINDVGVLKKYLYGDSDSGLQAQFSLPEVRYVEKTFGVSSTTSQEEWNEIIRTGQLKSALDEQKQILSSGANSVKNAMQDYLTFVSTVGGEYDKVNNKIINAASKLIGGLSDKTVIELGKSETQIRSTVTGFIDKLQKDPNLMSAFEKITSIDSSSSLNEIINSAGMVDVLESQLGLNGGSLNKLIGIDAKSIKKSYDKASKSVAKFNKVESKTGKILEDNKDLLDEFIDKNNINSEAELDKLKSLIDKSDTWQDVLNDWVLEGLDFENIDTELESLEANLISVKNAFDKLNKAIQESNSSSGMSGESIDNLKSLFSGLKGYDADKLFEDTYGGVRANPQELAKLTKEYKQTNYSKYTGEVADLEKKYAELSVQIDKSSSAVERNQALQERDKIKEKIKDAEMLQSQYEGLTNAVNMWQQAQSRGDEGDLYESVRGGFDEAKKLFDEGWIGDDRFQAFTQMFSKEDLSGAGSDIYEQVFANSLPKMERWFAEGTQGANNFLNDIAALNEGLVDAQGNVNWDKLPDMDTLADQLGVDVSLINTMFKALNRAGADLDFSEAADRLRGLRTEVENVGKGLDDATREKYTVDLDVENAEDIDAAIKQAEALKEEAKGNADATEYLSKQIDYLHAKAGEKTTMEVDIYSEEGIKNLNKDLDVLNSKLDEDHKLKIEWDKLTPENIKSQIDSATNAVRGFVNEDGKLDIETDGAQEALNILQALQQKAWDMNAESNILLRVDKSQVDSSTAQVIDDFAEIQAAAHNLESLKVTPGVEDSQLEKAKTKLQTLINEFNSSKGGMTATMDLKNLKIIDLASGKIDNLSSKLTSLNASSVLSALGVAENAIVGTQLPDKELTVKTKLIKGETETWKPSPKTQTVTAQLRKGDVNTWIPARRTQYVDVVKVSKGGNKVNGNANVNGNASLWQRGKAFAKGTWGAVKNSVALTGELGRELIVRGNEWFTIGNNGAEFNEIKKGDIVFNHY